MRDLAFDFFQRSPAMAGPVVALLVFFVVFAVAAARAVRARRQDLERAARLVLEGEEKTHERP